MRDREKDRETYREICSIHWFNLHMAVTIRSGLGRSQKLQSDLPYVWQVHVLGPASAFAGALAGNWIGPALQ